MKKTTAMRTAFPMMAARRCPREPCATCDALEGQFKRYQRQVAERIGLRTYLLAMESDAPRRRVRAAPRSGA